MPSVKFSADGDQPPQNNVETTQQHFSAAGEHADASGTATNHKPGGVPPTPSQNTSTNNSSPSATSSPAVTFFTDGHNTASSPRRAPSFQSVGGGKYVPTRESGGGRIMRREGSAYSSSGAPQTAGGNNNNNKRYYSVKKGAKQIDIPTIVTTGPSDGAPATLTTADHNAPNADTSSMATVSPRRIAAYSTNGAGGGVDDDELLYSDDSVESDFDYDEEGKPRTYYKKPRRTVAFDPFANAGGATRDSYASSHPRDSTYAPRSAAGAGTTAAGLSDTAINRNSANTIGDGEEDSLLHRNTAAANNNGGGYGVTSAATKASMASRNASMLGNRGLPLNAFYDALAASRASVKMNRQRIWSTVTEHQRSPSVMGLPENLRGLGREIHKLSTEELLYISSMVSRKAHREAFSVLQYTGKAWYLPNIRRIDPEAGETKRWDWPRYRFEEGLVLTIGGRVMTIQPRGYLVRLVVLALFWVLLWSALPQKLSEPGGYIFDALITFVLSAIVGGFICRLLQIPPLVGVLWVAIIYNNVPHYHELTHGILPEVKVLASRLGLTVVLLRAGFSTSWKAMRPLWKNVAILSVVALLAEGAVHTVMTNYLFDYNDWTWASLEGFLCAVPSAAIMVPSALLLQGEGWSKTKGPLPLVLSTVGVETVMGVWVSSFINGIAVGGASITMSLIMGPVQIVGGIILAAILAFAFVHAIKWIKHEAKRMPNGEFSQEHLDHVSHFSLVVFLLTAFAVVFFGNKYELGGGACVTVMLFATLVAHFWIKDGDSELIEQKKSLGAGLCSAWELLIMPFLFSMTGTKVNLKTIFSAEVFPKGLLLWVASVATRMIVVFFSTMGLGFSLKEKLYACGTWMAKATVQSALAGVALTAVTNKLAGFDAEGDPSGYASLLINKERAEKVQNIAILFVILSAPTAAVWMIKMGPRVLPRED